MVGSSLGLEGRVSDGRSDGGLDVALDGVADTFGMGLGIGGLLGNLCLGLLGGTFAGKGRVSDGFTDGLLGASDELVGGVLESVSHCVLEWLGWKRGGGCVDLFVGLVGAVEVVVVDEEFGVRIAAFLY